MDTREYKAAVVGIKALSEKGEGVLRFIRFEQEDKDADITRRGFIGQQEALLIPAHNWRSDQPPLGRGVSYEDAEGTNFHFKLNLNNPLAQKWYDWLQFDGQFPRRLQQISYGFSPAPDAQERGMKDGRPVRYLKPRPDGSPGATLHEVSFVLVGAGDTDVVAVKSVHPQPGRRLWPGGVTRMSAPREAIGHAMQSIRSSRRQLFQVRRLLDDLPSHSKATHLRECTDAAIDELETAEERHGSLLDVLDHLPPPVIGEALPPPQPEPPTPPPEPPPDDEDEPKPDGEPPEGKGGGRPIREDVQHLKAHLDRVTARLEAIQRLRGTASDRYPNGRPMPTDLLADVDDVIPRLSRLKAFGEADKAQEAEQHELQEMAERFKALGVSV